MANTFRTVNRETDVFAQKITERMNQDEEFWLKDDSNAYTSIEALREGAINYTLTMTRDQWMKLFHGK